MAGEALGEAAAQLRAPCLTPQPLEVVAAAKPSNSSPACLALSPAPACPLNQGFLTAMALTTLR